MLVPALSPPPLPFTPLSFTLRARSNDDTSVDGVAAVENPDGSDGITLSDSNTNDSATPLPGEGKWIPFDDAQISAEGREDGGSAASFASGGNGDGWDGEGRAEVMRA